MSTIYVDNLEPNLGSRVLAAGHVVQVVYGELTGKVTYNQQSFGNIGLSATITPTSASSKILITICFGRLGTNQTNGDHGAAIKVLRGSVDSDLNGLADGNRPRAAFKIEGRVFNNDHTHGGYGMTGIDSPATTSSVTYTVQAWNQSSSYPLTINASHADLNVNEDYAVRTKSFIILQEIAQ